MQPRLHRQILIAVSEKPAFVCDDGEHKLQNSSAAESLVYSLPYAQMSAKSFCLVRQLLGGRQETARAHKHTHTHTQALFGLELLKA